MQRTPWETPGRMKHKLDSRLQGKCQHLTYASDATLMAEREEEPENILTRVKGEGEKAGLKLSIMKN